MPIPQQGKIRRPLLEYISKHGQVNMRDAIQAMADHFSLTEQERIERLASGSRRFDNRVQWSKLGLVAAMFLETPERGVWRITERGRQALAKPGDINRKFLMQYPEYVEWAEQSDEPKRNGNNGATSQDEQEIAQDVNPEEVLESSVQAIQEALAVELLEKVKSSSPQFFERLVVDLLVSMGYGGSLKDAGQAVGQSGDGGIDGIIKEDKLGLDAIYVQAKRWQGTVGRPEIQAFAGSLEGVRARKGVFITTSKFTRDALDYVERIEKKIILIDDKQLAHYMIEHGVGVSETARYIVKKIDLDYFDAE